MGKKVGMIGLGNMGGGMCANFIRKGNDVTFYDPKPAAMARFEGQGRAAKSPMEVYENSDYIFLSLPNSDIVEAVLEPMIEAGMEGKFVVDTSTSYPFSTKELYKRIHAAGGKMCDSPVLLGGKEAEEGTLLALLGGTEEEIEEIKDLILNIAKSYSYMGPCGNAHLMKLGVNYCALCQGAMYAQVYPVMKAFGIDEKTAFDNLNNETFDNWVFQDYSRRYINHRYYDEAGFTLNNGIKDLSYMKRLFEAANVPGFVLDGALSLARVTQLNQTPEKPLEFCHMGNTMFRLFGFDDAL